MNYILRDLVRDVTGHDKTVPSWVNDNCPRTGRDLQLDDEIVIVLATSDGQEVHKQVVLRAAATDDEILSFEKALSGEYMDDD